MQLNGVTGILFILPLKTTTTTNNKTYETTVFKTLGIEPCRTVIPERWATIEVNSTNDSAYCRERVFICSAGQKAPGEAWQTPCIEKVQLSVLEAPWLQFTGRCTGKERATKKENPRDVQRVLLEYTTEDRSMHVDDETT